MPTDQKMEINTLSKELNRMQPRKYTRKSISSVPSGKRHALNLLELELESTVHEHTRTHRNLKALCINLLKEKRLLEDDRGKISTNAYDESIDRTQSLYQPRRLSYMEFANDLSVVDATGGKKYLKRCKSDSVSSIDNKLKSGVTHEQHKQLSIVKKQSQIELLAYTTKQNTNNKKSFRGTRQKYSFYGSIVERQIDREKENDMNKRTTHNKIRTQNPEDNTIKFSSIVKPTIFLLFASMFIMMCKLFLFNYWDTPVMMC